MTKTKQEELPPQCGSTHYAGCECHEANHAQAIATLKAEKQEQALQYLSDQGQWIEETGRLKAENERLHKLLDDAEAVLVRQRDARTTAQTQAAAMAGLLEEARKEIMYWTGGHEATSTKSYLNNLLPRIDAAIAAMQREGEGK